MALDGALQVGYQSGKDKASAFPQAFDKVGSYLAGKEEQNNKQKQAMDLLKQFGMLKTTTEEPSLEELELGAKEFAKSQGSELVINKGDNPEEARKNLTGIYKALGIPLPKGKTKSELNLAPGTKYDPMKGDVDFNTSKDLSSMFGLNPTAIQAPEGFEITGYDQKGKPMIRKIKEDKVSPTIQKLEVEKRGELNDIIEQNKSKREEIKGALDALDKLPSGRLGRIQMRATRELDPDNEIVGEWQKVKSVLTDITLLNTAKTKGAISDKEMELFKQAAADDNLLSKPAVKVAFNKLLKFLDTEEKSKRKTYEESFGNENVSQETSVDPDYQKYLEAIGQ